MKIVDDLISGLGSDAPVREVRIGPLLTAVWSREVGLASTLGCGEHDHGAPLVRDAGSLTDRSALELAKLACSDSALEASIGMAAINSLLEVDESRCVELTARDFLIERGRGKRVALIGHFPFVPELREAAGQLWVIELDPRPGDVDVEEGNALIPEADNSALMTRNDVRDDLSKADLVVAKLDAPDEHLFRLINRPLIDCSVSEIIAAVGRFRSAYRGKLALQMMFISGNMSAAREMALIARELAPEEVQLNTPLRHSPVAPLSEDELSRVRGEFEDVENVITVYDHFPPRVEPLDEAETRRRRPAFVDEKGRWP